MFLRHVLVMFSGTAIGQMAGVLLAPVLTRLYNPDAFGVLGAFSAGLMILSVIGALRYEMALPLTPTRKDSSNLLGACGLSLLFTTALFGFVLFIVSLSFKSWSFLRELEAYAYLLPIGFFAISAYQIMVYLATREERFKELAHTKIVQGVSGPVSQIIMGLAGFGSLGLLLGFIIGQSMGVGLLLKKLVLKTGLMADASWRGIKEQAARYKKFPFVSSWSGLINSAGGTMALLVAMPILYPLKIAGFVFLVDRVIGRPLLMISTSIMQVYIGDVSKSLKENPAGVQKRFLGVLVRQGALVFAWLALVNILAPFLFGPVFGPEWAEAVPYIHVLSLAYLFQMSMHSLVHTLQILERQALSMVWEASRFVLILGIFIAAHAYQLSALDCLLYYSLAQAGMHVILCALMLVSMKNLK